MDASMRNQFPGNGMRIIVAGGAGFLGSHLCAKLLQRGCSVLAMDNLSTGSVRNIAALFGQGDFHFVQHDIVSPVALQADWIFNMAGCAAPRNCRRDPEKIVRACTDGAANLLREAQSCHARILQASSGCRHGGTGTAYLYGYDYGASSEEWSRACYQEGAQYAEAMFFDFHRTRGVDVKVARIFNGFGPHMQTDDGNVIANFITQALRNQPLTLRMDGNQTRSFCYVDDLVDGILKVMAAPKTLLGPVDLGNPEETTIAELAARIIRLTGSRSKVVHRWVPSAGPAKPRPDISLARAELAWSPHVSLDVGLARTIQWFESVLDHARPKADLASSFT
jgi:UDP-glucuronate decarboxylase